MKHCGTQTLETGRLLLRRFQPQDAPAMFRNWASDPEVTKFLTWPTYQEEATAVAIIDTWIQNYDKEDFYQWAIVLKELGQPIGSISVVEQNERAQMMKIGYCIGAAWWHQGIMTEALGAVMDYLFGQVGVNRIQAMHDVNNPHSGGVMEKCGMRYEATLRQAGWNNTGICDMCCYALLRKERNMG